MSCDRIEKVSLFVDGELPEHESREVERHLLQCVDCRQAQTDFLSFRNQIGAYLPQLEPSSQREALNKILNRKPEKAPLRGSARPGWRWSFTPQLAAFAAVILLAAIIGVVVYKNATPQESNSTQAHLQPPSVDKTAGRRPDRTTPPVPAASPTTPAPKATPSPTRIPKPAVRDRLPMLPDPQIFASNGSRTDASLRSADTQALTAMHLEKSELLLRAFRNVRLGESQRTAAVEYERKQAQQLITQNMILRREADAAGDVQVASLLENLEPILLDIANLPKKPAADDIKVINDRVERKNIVALLQVNSTVLARALDDD